jgi:protease-4
MVEKQSSFLQVLRFLAKLWVIVTAVIGSLLVIGIVLIVVAFRSMNHETPAHLPNQKVLSEDGPNKIAVLNLEGEILDSESSGGFAANPQAVTARKVTELIDEIEKDNSIKAVILRINSPGGAVVASDEIYQRIKKLRTHKPVVASMSDLAASGGYYIAAGANSIVANPATITGSIGVIAHFPKLSGLYSKVGVEMRTIKSGKFKDIGSADRDFTPEEEAIFNSMIREAYDQFVQAIADGRSMDKTKVLQLADGRIYTGNQAKQNGLVDELGNFDDAIHKARELAHIDHATVVEFSDQNFFEALFQSKLSGFSFASVTQELLPQRTFGIYYKLEL